MSLLTTTAKRVDPKGGALALRLALFVVLGFGEFLLATYIIEIPRREGFAPWNNPVPWANTLAFIAVSAFMLLLAISWPRRREVFAIIQSDAGSGVAVGVGVNLALFAALLLTGSSLSHAQTPALYALIPYALLLLTTGASLALLAAPFETWRRLVRLLPAEIAVSFVGATVAVLLGSVLQGSWSALSGATLTLSHWFLTLVEPEVHLDVAERIVGVRDFGVQVNDECSGYEGIALVVAFLATYLWVFRRALRFPNALLLFPIGVATIWIMNSLRIAALVELGAHVSPTVAVQGFHSKAGWICFLLVTLGIIAVSRRISFFSSRGEAAVASAPTGAALPVATPDDADRAGAQVTLQYLAPFMALMTASIVTSAFAPHDQALYPLKVFAIAAVCWWYRDAYRSLLSGTSALAVAVGAAVGVIWIATEPASEAGASLGAFIAGLPVWLAVSWLVMRGIGTIIMVPIAEELAFRGYLSRALISSRFENVPVGAFSALAFVGSTVAFGLIHQRWLAAMLAGAVYALLMYRSKKLSDPIAAHMASNAIIFLWAVAVQEWALL